MNAHAQSPLSSAFENISTLLANLEEKDIDNVEVKRLHESVGTLMSRVSDRQLDLLGDLTAILATFTDGRMTPGQLEAMIVTEQERSAFILDLSTTIGSHIGQLFQMIESIFSRIEMGKAISKDSMKSVSRKMNVVSESVDSISRIINTPAHLLKSVIGDVKQDIASVSGLNNDKENSDDRLTELVTGHQTPGSSVASPSSKRLMDSRRLGGSPQPPIKRNGGAAPSMIDFACQVDFPRPYDAAPSVSVASSPSPAGYVVIYPVSQYCEF